MLTRLSQSLRPAAYLKQAEADYARLVPTHPMEASEWQDGLAVCRELAADLIYAGKWPEQAALPDILPEVGEPLANGGLTRSEQLVSSDLVQFWNSLPQSGHVAPMATAIHTCQSMLQSRILRRMFPDYWASTPSALNLDATAEQQRWNLAIPVATP